MVLQRLIQEQHLALTDSLLDNNNTVLKVISVYGLSFTSTGKKCYQSIL